MNTLIQAIRDDTKRRECLQDALNGNAKPTIEEWALVGKLIRKMQILDYTKEQGDK